MTDETLFAKRSLTDVFGLMTDEFRAEVIGRALEWRRQASGEVRKSFLSALRSTVKIKGFRNPNKADNHQLQREISRLLRVSPELSGSMLRIWMESHPELYDLVAKHLSDLEISTEGPDFSQNCFTGSWSPGSWKREKERIAASHSQFNEDDVALMLCCVTGKLPDSNGDEVEEPDETQSDTVFARFLAELRALPADAGAWDGASGFVAKVSELIQAKEEERHQVDHLNATLAEMRQEYGRELAFFQCNADSWSAERLPGQKPGKPAASPEVGELMHLIGRLNALLADYRPLHETAPVIQEELNLVPRRTELQKQILECLSEVYQLFSARETPENDLQLSSAGVTLPAPVTTTAASDYEGGAVQKVGPTQNGPPLPADAQSNQPERGEGPGLKKPTLTELAKEDDLTDDLDLSTDVGKAESPDEPNSQDGTVYSESDYFLLKSDNQALKQENETLQSDLRACRSDVRRWRNSYEEVSHLLANTGERESLSIGDVSAAVALAKEKYADRLLFQPNSKSEINDNPFEKPKTVWTAFKWLATTYYYSRIGEGEESNHDLSLLKECGWHYKSHQSDTTMRKYKPWYTTTLNRKTYWLKKHIGTGSNKDARYTIRIGFEWDKEKKVIVIGYIGQHPRTDAT